MSWEVIQIRLYDVFYIVKSIRHRTLKGSTGIFEAEGDLFISKGAPGTDEGGLMLICRSNVDLVVARKTVHKRINLATRTFIDKLVDKGSGVVVFWTCSVDITVVNADANGALLFIDRDNV